MPINPVHFAHGVCDEFLRYVFSAFPLSDPELADQARKKLKGRSSLDIPLVRGPFVSLSEAFAKGESVQQMAQQGLLHHVMPALIDYPSMYLHQQRVFEAVRQGSHVLVATGTGSGKTESFLYPIIDDLLRQRDKGIRSGLSAILIYPMNALANDQLDRLRDMLGGTGITFGQWVGTTPDKESGVTVDKFDGTSRDAYREARRKRRAEAQAEDRAVRPLAPREECCSEEDIRDRQPRILLTNYRQLEVLTTRLPDVSIFANAPIQYLVFDEAHTYAGATGAEVACLVRRVRALAGKKPDEIICIGTSATLVDRGSWIVRRGSCVVDREEDNEPRTTIHDPRSTNHEPPEIRFASRFFGVDSKKVALVGESYVSREWPKDRYRPAAPSGDGVERLNRVLHIISRTDTLVGPDRQECLSHLKTAVEELTGQTFDPGDDWRRSLFDTLLTNEYVFQSTQVLQRPNTLEAAAWATSQRVAMNRMPQGDKANAELLCYLVLGAAAQKDTESLLRPKVHFFIRGLDEMVVALSGSGTGTPACPADKSVCPTAKMDLFLSLSEGKEQHAGRHDDAFFPVLTCRNCGQHFFERYYQNLEFNRGPRNQLRGFENGNATQDDGGKENAVWSTVPVESGTRLVVTNRLLEEADSGTGTPAGQPTTRSTRWPRAFFCRQCGES